VPVADITTMLDAFGHPVAVVDAEWAVIAENAPWRHALRIAGSLDDRTLWSSAWPLAVGEAAAAVRATAEDRRPRDFPIVGSDTGARMRGRVAAFGDGQLLIELHILDSETAANEDEGRVETEVDDETTSLRALTRHVAGVADSRVLLDLLCESADVQCHASGAGVISVDEGIGEIVAAVGIVSSVCGRRFPIAGSIAEETIRTTRPVAVDDLASSRRPVTRVVPEIEVGPVLVAPLIAHDNVMGVLAVARERGATPFSEAESLRLRILADYAALALWKADLLERAKAADQAKSRFLATVSHELRTPLTALTGYEELLADEVLGPLTESQADVLERMRAVTHHLTVVIEEVLAFSSLESGRERLRPTEFLAADLVRAAAAVIEPQARQKHLDLIVDTPAEPLRMFSDVEKIQQILVNLAGNAVKFTDEGEVRLSVIRDADREVAHFMVCDSGIGIDAQDLGRLFQPFAQLDAGLTRRHGGTGLGLYISQRLASLLGGEIRVKSQAGKGSVFSVLLPLECPV